MKRVAARAVWRASSPASNRTTTIVSTAIAPLPHSLRNRLFHLVEGLGWARVRQTANYILQTRGLRLSQWTQRDSSGRLFDYKFLR